MLITVDGTGGGGGRIFRATGVGGAEAMTISGLGHVAIGHNDPAHMLHIIGDRADSLLKIFNDGDDANRYGIELQCGTNDQSGTTYFMNCLDGDGSAVGVIENASGTFQLRDTSDSRLKDNIRDTEIDGTSIINSIKVRDFEWKNNKVSVSAGFVAQELRECFPQAVSGKEDAVLRDGKIDPLGISKERLVPVLVKAVQELYTANDELKARIEALEA